MTTNSKTELEAAEKLAFKLAFELSMAECEFEKRCKAIKSSKGRAEHKAKLAFKALEAAVQVSDLKGLVAAAEAEVLRLQKLAEAA